MSKMKKESGKNAFAYKVFQKFTSSMAPDVHFIFENEDKTVKIPAHKGLLAVASPVFDAMFNGELKEKGDVEIVDASVAAFKEFLQFVYSDKVKLTMENIEDVLYLAHKYDIDEVITAAVGFIKKHLKADETMWCLQLAIKYNLDELKARCKKLIQLDPMNALNIDDAIDAEVESENLAEKQQQQQQVNAWQMLKEVLSISKEIIYESRRNLIFDVSTEMLCIDSENDSGRNGLFE